VYKYLALVLLPALLLAACGGGGSSSSNGGGSTSGGGGTGGTQTISPPGPPNVESIYVDAGPSELQAANEATVNTPYVTIEICVPNTSTCQTIDHIEVDTGSVGLRIISEALSISLPAVTDSGSASGHPLAECLQFADGSSWGSVNNADVTLPISGEKASMLNVQVIGAASVGGTTPSTSICPGTTQENTIVSFGAKGIMGIGPFINDCDSGGTCDFSLLQSAIYYSCTSNTSTSCSGYDATLAQQLQNPVTDFGTDNNGSIIELPAISSSGVASVKGSLVFGINTENNNALAANVTELQADPVTGFITASLNGNTLTDSYLDSGSNGNFFASSLPICPGPSGQAETTGFYCPSSTTTENATLSSPVGNGSLAASFTVANAETLFTNNATFTGFPNLGGTVADSATLDLGLPFFYGTNIYTGIENGSSAQPFFAF
jgi:Protein of unknown function (DUF3443)